MATPRPPAVTWSVGPPTSRIVRGVLYLPVGLLGGLVVLVVGLLGFGLSRLVFDGGSPLVALGIAIAGAFGLARLGLLYWAVATDDDLQPVVATLRLPWLVVSVLLGAGVVFLSLSHSWPAFVLVFVGGVMAPSAVASFFVGEGEFVPDSATLRLRDQTVDVTVISDFRRFSVGPWTVFRLTYLPGTTDFRTPRTIVVPASVAGAVQRVLTWGQTRAEVSDTTEEPLTSPLARRLLLLGGVGMLLFAGGLYVVLMERGADVVFRGYVTLVVGLFGLIFIAVGLRER